MSYTQAHLDALRAALVSGATRVTYEGRTVEYRTIADLERVIATVERSLGLRGPASRITYPEVTRGHE